MCTAAYQGVRSGDAVWPLRPYAGTNPGEFFAVATEVVLHAAGAAAGAPAGLYAVLTGYYRQDPARRVLAAVGDRGDA